jgi:uncharacterized membrane protein
MPSDWWPMPFFGMMMPVMMVIFLAVAFVIIFLLMRAFGLRPAEWRGSRPCAGIGPQRTSLDILNERFARGEIDQAEYEAKRRIISQG